MARSRGDGALYFEQDDRRPERVVTIDGKRQRLRGRWVGRITVDGKRHRVIGATKTEAKRKLDALKADTATGKAITSGSITVKQLLDQWLADGAPARRRRGRAMTGSTLSVHEWAARRWIDAIGAKKVRSLRARDVSAELRRAAEAGLSRSSLTKLRTTLSLALRWGVVQDLAPADVAAPVDLPPVEAGPRDGRAMTEDQARRFAAAAEESPHACLWTIMLNLGLRIGEASALQWADIDAEAGTITVARTVQRDGKGRLSLGETTKTGSKGARTLRAPAVVLDAIKAHKAAQAALRLEYGPMWTNADDLLFHNGGAILQPKALRRDFDAITKRAKLDADNWTPHHLRHTAATLAVANGVPMEAVADMLGHQSTRMVEATYRHAPAIVDATAVADRLEAL